MPKSGQRVRNVIEKHSLMKVDDRQHLELHAAQNCVCESEGDSLYLGTNQLQRGPRCTEHAQGLKAYLVGLLVGALFFFGIATSVIEISNFFAVQSLHSLTVLKLTTQQNLLFSAMLFFDPVSTHIPLHAQAASRVNVLLYCASASWLLWHISHNKKLSVFRRLLWSVFTLSACVMLSLVVPAAIYSYKFLSTARRKILWLAIVSFSLVVMGISLVNCYLILLIASYFVFVFSFPFLCSEKAWLWINDCMLVQKKKWRVPNMITQGQVAIVAPTIISLESKNSLGSDAAHHAKQIGIAEGDNSSTIKVNQKTPQHAN